MKQSIINLKFWSAALVLAATMSGSGWAAYIAGASPNPDIIDNHVTINGGLVLTMEGTSTAGVTLQLDDIEITTAVYHPQLSFIGNETVPALWVWGYDDGASGVTRQLTLNESNQLELHDPVTPFAAQIVLDPDATTPSIIIGGETVLTTSSGTAPYLSTSLPISAGSGQDSVQIGDAIASGGSSFAVGYYAHAGGSYSAALGIGTADGAVSTGLGAGWAQGDYSTAMGYYSTAIGHSSTSMGYFATAQSYASLVVGRYNILQGDPLNWVAIDDLFVVGNGSDGNNRSNAFVVKKNGDTHVSGRLSSGTAVATGLGAVAFGGYSSAEGDYSYVFGDDVYAYGYASSAFGYSGIAFGDGSTAFGYSTSANGGNSAAFGSESITNGDSSIAMGHRTTAQSYVSIALGRYNIAQGDTQSWVATDDLFVVGNGVSFSDRSNALVIRKNGEVEASVVRVAPSGDLDMGIYTSGTDPRENLDPNHLHWTP